MQDLHLALAGFGKCRTMLHPVTVVRVPGAVHVANGGSVDVTADDTVEAATRCIARGSLLVATNGIIGGFQAQLDA
ncbi:MAG TPA: hypothetical protein VMO24_04455 [Woeseiaceae bacterium]|nr:hypothetical protein [Woeseiaceae bacterium]